VDGSAAVWIKGNVMSVAAWPVLAVFCALVLTMAMYGLAVSGHFPSEHRGRQFRTPGGRTLMWGSMLVAIMLTVAGGILAMKVLPWYAAVIGGGGALLAAPMLLQALPDRVVDGRRGLLAFVMVGAALTHALGRLTS
jgi:hypothetical protein